MNSPLQGKIYLFWYILRKARCLGGSSLMFYKMSVQDIYYGYRVLMLSHEKVSPKFFKFHQRFQKTRQNCKQRLLEKICILYGCFEVPMYQDNVCRACSIFVLVVLCRSIVYARTSWTYRYYSIETLFYVYRGPRYTKTMLQLLLFSILLQNKENRGQKSQTMTSQQYDHGFLSIFFLMVIRRACHQSLSLCCN